VPEGASSTMSRWDNNHEELVPLTVFVVGAPAPDAVPPALLLADFATRRGQQLRRRGDEKERETERKTVRPSALSRARQSEMIGRESEGGCACASRASIHF